MKPTKMRKPSDMRGARRSQATDRGSRNAQVCSSVEGLKTFTASVCCEENPTVTTEDDL